MRPLTLSLTGTALLAAVISSHPVGLCAAEHGHEHAHEHADASKRAVAVMRPAGAEDDLGGTVLFTAAHAGDTDQVHIQARITGLEPDSTHAIHIHEYGDATAADATSAGGHYNPAGHEHGLPDADTRHAGDLGNLSADGDGVATLSMTVDNITVAGDRHPVLGRSVIIHAKKDDGGQPTGNAGARIGIGVIGVANDDTALD